MKDTVGSEPRHAARALLVAAALGNCYLAFFRYKASGFDDPLAFDGRLQGHSPAPEQYRAGLYWVAQRLATHLHLAPTMVLALLDGGAAIFSVLLLFRILEHSAVYATAGRMLRWFGAATFVLLVMWYLAWLPWLQKAETLPATAFVAAMLWLWHLRTFGSATWYKATALVLLSAALATFRADAALLLNAGVLLSLALNAKEPPWPRTAAMLTAAIGALSAGGIQLWLVRVAYPAASYGRVKMWQLWPNLKHASRWPPFVIFMLPLLWMVWQGWRRGLPKDAASRAVFLGAGLYAVLWIAIGKIDEVRIFVPFALALTPLTVQVALQALQEPPVPS